MVAVLQPLLILKEKMRFCGPKTKKTKAEIVG